MASLYDAIEEDIAITGFYSEYLPSCFILDERVFKKAPPSKCDLIAPYSFTMSRYNKNDARRHVSIPEIGAYINARNYLKSEKIIEELIKFTQTQDVSFSPILGNDHQIMRHEQSYDNDIGSLDQISSDFIDNIAKKIIRSSGAKKIMKLDISNCYSSFYMHMIPAILLGLEDANLNYNRSLKNRDDLNISRVYKKYAKLDGVLRRQNLNRTNGLLPGPLTSKIIAEGILTRIDIELKKENIKYSRYVDDYEVYLFDDNEKEITSIFTKVLERYGFSLNNSTFPVKSCYLIIV